MDLYGKKRDFKFYKKIKILVYQGIGDTSVGAQSVGQPSVANPSVPVPIVAKQKAMQAA